VSSYVRLEVLDGEAVRAVEDGEGFGAARSDL
jgi:hypothetical protein